ncbi:MAG: endopeptidase La [Oscillospiraceae bacterium]|nr:endopeptidase La [Oscillospiraceae bacterium]
MDILEKEFLTLPVMPLRGTTMFPGMVLNFDVERAISRAAVEKAFAADNQIFLVTQKQLSKEEPEADDLYSVGTLCTISQILRVQGSSMMKVRVEGVCRAKITELLALRPHITASIEPLTEPEAPTGARVEAEIRKCIGLFNQYSLATASVAPETMLRVIDMTDCGALADYVAQNVYFQHSHKQLVLDEVRPLKRLQLVSDLLVRELDVLNLQRLLDEDTHEQIDADQRDYYLREQMKVIQRELGDGDGEYGDETEEYEKKIMALHLPRESEEKLLKEVSRMAKQPFGSAESAVTRTYLDICLDLPWGKRTRDTTDIARARKCLDADHYGLEKVKERIIEFLAVRSLAPKLTGGVLCLVGPPGVGKTSIAMSIARATNRKLARISLGGVHDEAEIRGHRKTYVGAMPGRIIAGMQQAKSMNPVMVLDEIDKMASDFRGDPASALLEALDGEQNGTFRDNFLEIPFDLSDVLFITTCNTTDTIPRALLDRMEVIELGSYTDEEKLLIAKEHLLPKQRKKHGLTAAKLKLSDEALREIIADYTRESGVRILERQLAAICRKTARIISEGERKSVSVKAGELQPLLGAPKYNRDRMYPTDEVGLVRGLAWTSVGGEVLDVEVSVMAGTGKLELTGNLGDVMKESAKAAVTYIRTRAEALGIDPEFYKNRDIHIHFPEGAVPKDGPSAGITVCVAVISALTGVPVRRDIAMTGEISLRGRVMAIGGLREKTMAALRCGIHTVIVPSENERDLDEIDPNVRKAMDFVLTDHVDKILAIALRRPAAAAEEAKPSFAFAEPHAKARSRVRQVTQ